MSGAAWFVCDVADCEQGFSTMAEVVAHERTHRTRAGDEAPKVGSSWDSKAQVSGAGNVEAWVRCPFCFAERPSWAKRAQWEHVDSAHRDDGRADTPWLSTAVVSGVAASVEASTSGPESHLPQGDTL